MAKIVTDYGLVYNDDGSFCATERKDEVPFSGVTSWAIETQTTNLIGHTNGRFNAVTGYGTTPPTVTLVDMKTPWGSQAWKVTIPANNATGYNGCRIETNGFPITAGVYYSYFTYVMFEGTLSASDLAIWPGGIQGMASMVLDATRNINNWQYFYKENIAPVLTGSDYFIYHVNTTSTVARTFYIAIGQFEQKPFCSSFVNGTRPNGRFIIPVEKLGFNPATDDWVVHYWKYPVATDDDNLTGLSLMSLGDWVSTYDKTFVYWGKTPGTNKFRLYYFYNDNTMEDAFSEIFDTNWYFRNWHHEVMLKHTYESGVSELQYWIDGILQVSSALTKPLKNNLTLGLTVGGYRGGFPSNSYIANLCYGKYTDQWNPNLFKNKLK